MLGGFVWAAVIVWGMSEQPSSYPQSAQFIDVMLMIVVIVSGVFSSMLFDALAEILERGRRNDWRAMKLFEVYVKLRQSEPTTQQTT